MPLAYYCQRGGSSILPALRPVFPAIPLLGHKRHLSVSPQPLMLSVRINRAFQLKVKPQCLPEATRRGISCRTAWLASSRPPTPRLRIRISTRLRRRSASPAQPRQASRFTCGEHGHCDHHRAQRSWVPRRNRCDPGQCGIWRDHGTLRFSGRNCSSCLSVRRYDQPKPILVDNDGSKQHATSSAVTIVPEPGTMALLGTGLLALGGLVRRRLLK